MDIQFIVDQTKVLRVLYMEGYLKLSLESHKESLRYFIIWFSYHFNTYSLQLYYTFLIFSSFAEDWGGRGWEV